MKILHSADWHIGKKLCGLSRIDEQREVFEEIESIAREEKVDLVVIAGDVFDTSMPSAEAEELFYETVLRLSKTCVVVALSGNHDDPDRLSAAKNLARAHNIVLAGGSYLHSDKKDLESGDGYLRITRDGVTLNLVVLPFMQLSSLSDASNKDLTYTEMIRQRLNDYALNAFDKSGFNGVASHLYMEGNNTKLAKILSDERELGGAALLPLSVIPSGTDFTLLGHIHKPYTVSKSNNIYYSGSILPYSFDDKADEKSVNILSLSIDGKGEKKVSVKKRILTKGKKLYKLEAKSFLECDELLEKYENSYLHLVYNGSEPLKLSELAKLKKHASFCKLENTFLSSSVESKTANSSTKSTSELFAEFYKRHYKTEKEPSESLMQMFLEVVEGD